MKDQTIKEQLLHKLNQLLDERIVAADKSIQSAKESRDNDTKSSAGDKYETGREMIQQEMDKLQAQLAKAQSMKNDLLQINPNKEYTQAEFGSLVCCNQGNYFFSVALGKIELDGTPYFCLSMVSPIGQALMQKRVGDELTFNGTRIVIQKIY
ncbi:GreA/GreB family elongation factor [Mangrovibacterium lignilyticum]|uniref:GreA/GreB family elongation factor n=1 Tax=Mangrovibacterium lignilyticum TaxID=2668052 RepID=UPI0013D80504|nr:GreA/GreB family elongation factor [Mangrovibacterium lignilyticum]